MKALLRTCLPLLAAAHVFGVQAAPASASAPTAMPPVGVTLTAEQWHALALEAQSGREGASMVRHLRAAAQEGFRPAQELLGLALLDGGAMLGVAGAVPANACEARDWFIRAAAQGSEIGRLQRDLINRRPPAQRCP